MIVCDLCKNISKPTFKCRVVLVKEEKKKTKGKEIISVEMDLCEDHISIACNMLGTFINKEIIHRNTPV